MDIASTLTLEVRDGRKQIVAFASQPMTPNAIAHFYNFPQLTKTPEQSLVKALYDDKNEKVRQGLSWNLHFEPFPTRKSNIVTGSCSFPHCLPPTAGQAQPASTNGRNRTILFGAG